VTLRGRKELISEVKVLSTVKKAPLLRNLRKCSEEERAGAKMRMKKGKRENRIQSADKNYR